MHFSGHYTAAQRTEDLCAIHYLTTQENLATQFLIKRKHFILHRHCSHSAGKAIMESDTTVTNNNSNKLLHY